MTKLAISFLFFCFLSTLSLGLVKAKSLYNFPSTTEGQVTEALEKIVPLRFLPSHPLYFSILVKESFQRLFKPSALKKAEFDLILSDKRLKETYVMLEGKNTKKASTSASAYSRKLKSLTSQIEKARSQNQDVTTVVDVALDHLKVQETLLSASYAKWQVIEDDNDFDQNFGTAISTFREVINAMDKIKPGAKGRFKII